MYSILKEAHTVAWWRWDEYDGDINTIDWLKVWQDVLDDPYPPADTSLKSILFTFEFLTKYLPMSIVFEYYYAPFCHFHDCPSLLYSRLCCNGNECI